MIKRLLLLFWIMLPLTAFSENYLLDVGEEQTLLVPDVSLGVVDHTVWTCNRENVEFIEKNNSYAKVKFTSYSDKEALVTLVYVAKYYDYKGFTRSYTGIKYYTIQCKGSTACLVPSGLNMKVGEKYQLHISPSSYEQSAVWSVWTYQGQYLTVDDNGLVEAKNEGTEIVFATIPNSSTPLTCLIYVKDTKLDLRADVKSGTVDKGQNITLTASKASATIYYTLDGTSPETNGEIYTEPIPINSDATLKAIAYDNDEEKEPSDILERQYTVKNNSVTDLDNTIYIEPMRVFAGDEMTLSIKMKNSATIRGFQFNLYLPSGVSAVTNAKGKIQASLNADRFDVDDEHTLSATEQNDGSILFLCGSQYEEDFIGNDGEVATVTLNVSENMKVGDYPITLKDIKISESDISNYYETSNFSANLTVLHYILGDINGDQKVDVSDYIGIANRIHGNTPDGFIEKVADVDDSGDVDISDYIGVANLIHTGSIYGDALHATIVTNDATSISEKGATLNGTLNVISATKPYTVGFFVAESGTPSSENNIKAIVNGSNKTGNFSSTVTGLAYSTTYYYCSYILYEGVYYYGETQSFTTTKKTTYAIGDLYPADNPIGVVFYISNGGKSGKIASLETVKRNWYGAKSWASSYGSGWYLPSKSELQNIASNWNKLSDYISNGFYWSSTVYSSGALDTLVWVVTLGYYMGYSNNSTFYNSADPNTRSVLAVKTF